MKRRNTYGSAYSSVCFEEDGFQKKLIYSDGWYEFEKDYFGFAFFEGKTIPCISLKGQKVFHSGYELRDKDKHDISILESLSE